MPRRAAASSRGGSGAPLCGDPWCHTSVAAGPPPASYARNVRPSASRRSRCATTIGTCYSRRTAPFVLAPEGRNGVAHDGAALVPLRATSRAPLRDVIGLNKVLGVRLLLNLIWLIFGGLVLALGYAIVALVMFILIITIPFGIASARIALFCLWPFGRTLIKRADAGAGSLIGNIIWFILAGWWLAIGHIITGILMCITIIGIPLGLANFKLIPVSVMPFGREIVDFEQARRLGYSGQVAVPVDPSR